jgi:ribosome-associated protein
MTESKGKKTAAKKPAPKAKPAKAASRSATKPATKATAAPKARAPKPAAAKAPKAAAPKKAPAPDDKAKRVALAIAEAGLDKKAVNVEIIDVLGKVDYADYLVVMSGRSDRQVAALARGIEEDVEEKTKTKCLGVEGASQGRWVLMDFGDVVVHIFHEDVRGYYDIESLWLDAVRVPLGATN